MLNAQKIKCNKLEGSIHFNLIMSFLENVTQPLKIILNIYLLKIIILWNDLLILPQTMYFTEIIVSILKRLNKILIIIIKKLLQ